MPIPVPQPLQNLYQFIHQQPILQQPTIALVALLRLIIQVHHLKQLLLMFGITATTLALAPGLPQRMYIQLVALTACNYPLRLLMVVPLLF